MGIQKGTIILTTTHINYHSVLEMLGAWSGTLNQGVLKPEALNPKP